MDMKITNKDKRLLSFLFSALVLVGMTRYLILPAQRGLDETEDLLEQAQIEKREMDIQMAVYPDYQEQYSEVQQRASKAVEDYYGVMTSQEVDRELTGIVLDNGLECISLQINPLVNIAAEPYARSEMAKQEAEENSGKKDKDKGKQKTQDQIYTCSVRLVAEGTERNYQRLIDLFVDDSPSIRVTSIAYQQGKSRYVVQKDGSKSYEQGRRQLVLGLEMYMCDKSFYDEAEAQSAAQTQDAEKALSAAETQDTEKAQSAAETQDAEKALNAAETQNTAQTDAAEQTESETKGAAES